MRAVTEPFSEDLHDKVLKYQDEFFVARVENVTRRKELPELAAAVSCTASLGGWD